MLKKLRQKYFRLKAKNKLIKQYEYLVEVNKILEEYITEKILVGGSTKFIEDGRKQLITKQSEIRENEAFLQFLSKVK